MPDSPSPEAMLWHSVVSTAAHDLGGLASALQLRADVLERLTEDRSATAVRAIALELRALGEQLRALPPAEGPDTLAPSRTGALLGWLARVRRFGRPLLGQSGLIDGEVHDTHVTSDTAHQLTLITLALLRDLRERWPEERLAVHITTELLDDRVRVQVRATAHGAALTITEPDGSAWWQWATARAAAASIPFRVNDGCVLLEVRRST